MQNNCNSLIPWKTFLMRKIWRFSAPSKRNLGLVVPGADVAVSGLSLSDYWAFWTLGTLAAAAAPLGEGGDRRGGRKESSDEEGWVCGVFTARINFVRICAVPAWLQLRDPIESPARPPTDTSLPMCPHVQASPMRPHSQGWLPVSSLWVCECQHWEGIRHQRNQNVTKDAKTHFKETLPWFH